MAEELDKPLLDPENFNRDRIDLVIFLRKQLTTEHIIQCALYGSETIPGD